MNKIVSNFYLIRLGDEPIYVGYTNRPIKQRFTEHKRDKDFGDIEPTVESLGKLEYDFTWDMSLINSYAREVSTKETELITQYGTNDTVWQVGVSGKIGGQTWANVKYFIKTNRNNPKFKALSEDAILSYLETSDKVSRYIQNFVRHMEDPVATYMNNFINDMSDPVARYMKNFVSGMEDPVARYMNNFVNHMDDPVAIYMGSFVSNMDDPVAIYMKNFINHMDDPVASYMKNFVGIMDDPVSIYMKNFVGGMADHVDIYMRSFVSGMDDPVSRYMKDFVGNMKKPIDN